MKKILYILSLLLIMASVRAQVPTDTADLRSKINAWIVTNGNKQITAVQINNLLNGITTLMTKYSVNGAYRINDTLFLTGPNMTTIKVTMTAGSGGSETDPTVPSAVKAITTTDITTWNAKQNALTTSSTVDIISNVISAKNTTALWNSNQIQGHAVATTNPTNGQALVWNSTTSRYEPSTVSGGEAIINPPNAIKKYWNGYKQFVDFLTDSIPEGTSNLYFTNSRARNAITLTTVGTTGPATYISGNINIPQYTGPNLYNIDGTLTGNRHVSGHGTSGLFLDSLTTFTVTSTGLGGNPAFQVGDGGSNFSVVSLGDVAGVGNKTKFIVDDPNLSIGAIGVNGMNLILNSFGTSNRVVLKTQIGFTGNNNIYLPAYNSGSDTLATKADVRAGGGGGGGGGGSSPFTKAGMGDQIQTNGGEKYLHASYTVPSSDTFYILNTGQSNAGYVYSTTATSDTVSNPKVQIFNRTTNTWVVATTITPPFPGVVGTTIAGNIAWYLGKYIQEATGKVVRILNYAHGGTGIVGWWTGTTTGADYDSVQAYVTASGWYRTDLFLWDQGESNASSTFFGSSGLTGTYLESWDSLISRFRGNAYFPKTTPSILVGMPRIIMGAGQNLTQIDNVLRGLGSDRDPYTGYASSLNAEVLPADIHFTNPGKKTIALNAFYQYLTLPKIVPEAILQPNYLMTYHTDSLNGNTSHLTGLNDVNTSSYGVAGLTMYAGLASNPLRGRILITGHNANFAWENDRMVYDAGGGVGTEHQFYLSSTKKVSIGSGNFQTFDVVPVLNNTSATGLNYIQYQGNSTNSRWWVGVAGTSYAGAPPSNFVWLAGANGFVANMDINGRLALNRLNATPQAQLDLNKGTAAANSAPIHFTLPSSTLLTVKLKGALETDSLGRLYFTDSTATRDTVAMRGWVESKIIGGGTTLVAGTKAVTVTGVTANSAVTVTCKSQGGTTATTATYIGVCTTNTVTISAVTSAGTNTVNTGDTSVIQYIVYIQ